MLSRLPTHDRPNRSQGGRVAVTQPDTAPPGARLLPAETPALAGSPHAEQATTSERRPTCPRPSQGRPRAPAPDLSRRSRIVRCVVPFGQGFLRCFPKNQKTGRLSRSFWWCELSMARSSNGGKRSRLGHPPALDKCERVVYCRWKVALRHKATWFIVCGPRRPAHRWSFCHRSRRRTWRVI
jgi:hypothetical protein